MMLRYNSCTVRSVLHRAETLPPKLTPGREVEVFLDGQRTALSVPALPSR